MKMMLVFLMALLCSSCTKDHATPAANLKFISIEREGIGLLYRIRYASDVNVLDLFGRGMGKVAASTTLECALGDDQDFSVAHQLRYSAYGSIDVDEGSQADGKFNFVTSAFLRQTRNKGTSQEDLSRQELNKLLPGKNQVPCKVVVTAWGYKPYYSNTLHIPVADLLREINKPH